MRAFVIFFLFIFFSLRCFAQPDPIKFYPEKIAEITEELKTLNIQKDSVRYHTLLWERAFMQVSLKMRSESPLFQTKDHDTLISKQIVGDLNYLINQDIKIGLGPFATSRLDFLITRGMFYNQTNKYQNALKDYFQIIELDSSERYREITLYKISITYFRMENIDSALLFVDQILDENISKRKFDNVLYSCELGSSMVNWKISILEKSGRKEALLSFYKKLIWQNRKIFWNDNSKCFKERLKELKAKT
jgi:tetratricopeptide (TPR) repeat protein